jgi:NAD-dependent deacetylase
LPPPRCAHCGGRIRPGVVWFGETLPANILKQAEAAARDGDLFLSVGTSALVYPAAGLPWTAAEAGALVAQINPDTTPLDSLAAVNLRGTAAQILPELVARAFLKTGESGRLP